MSSRRPGPGMPGLPPGVTPEMMQKMMRKMPPGGMPGMPGQPPQQAPSKEQFNPLPDGKGAIQILKAHAGCQMPREAATLQALLTKTQEMPHAAAREAELDAAMAEAIALIFRSDRECEKQMSTRTAGLFNEEPELRDLSDKINILFKDLHEMEEALKAKAELYNSLSQQRWEKAVKLFGLNIQERFYRIDSEKKAVQQLDLKCENCQGIKLLKDARQKLAHILIAVETEPHGVIVEPLKEEKTDGREETAGCSADVGPSDRPSEGTPTSSGETT
jgi:hypothetical protein